MKHAWLELEDGTAKCRRCPAVRRPTSKVYRSERVLRQDCDGFLYYEVETSSTTAVEVVGAHSTKCGRPS